MLSVEVGIMVRSAYVSHPDYEWTIALRKKDDSEVGDIAKHHKDKITPSYLRDLLKGFENIEWKELNTPPMFPREIKGECGDYNIFIILKDDNKQPKDEVIEQFINVLSG